MANPHLPDAYVRRVYGLYEGTRLERQELHGELLTDVPGALWTEKLLERCRKKAPPPAPPANAGGEQYSPASPSTISWRGPGGGPFNSPFTRLVIGVDPPSGDGTCGIIVCAKDADGRAHILADHSVTARGPEGWAKAVAEAARIHSLAPPRNGEGDHAQHGGGVGGAAAGGVGTGITPLIVVEVNQGGRMVEAVLRAADAGLRIKSVHAAQGKAARADPIATLFEAGKVILHGHLPELEAELCGLIAGGGYQPAFAAGREGGGSPDRADAMVWALTELMLEKERAPPRVLGF